MLFLKKGIHGYMQEGRLKKMHLIKEQVSEGRNNGFQAYMGLSKKKVNKPLSVPAVDSSHMLNFH